jgi:Fasciclin domain
MFARKSLLKATALALPFGLAATAQAELPGEQQQSCEQARVEGAPDILRKATVVEPGIRADNGVIHGIDAVLVPQEIVKDAGGGEAGSRLSQEIRAKSRSGPDRPAFRIRRRPQVWSDEQSWRDANTCLPMRIAATSPQPRQ